MTCDPRPPSRPVPPRKYTTKKEERAFREAYRCCARELIPLYRRGEIGSWGRAEVREFWRRLDQWAEMGAGAGLPRIVRGRPAYLEEGAETALLGRFLRAGGG